MSSTVPRESRHGRGQNMGWRAIFKGWLTGTETVEPSAGRAESNTSSSRGISTMLPSGSLFSTIYAGRRIPCPDRLDTPTSENSSKRTS